MSDLLASLPRPTFVFSLSGTLLELSRSAQALPWPAGRAPATFQAVIAELAPAGRLRAELVQAFVRQAEGPPDAPGETIALPTPPLFPQTGFREVVLTLWRLPANQLGLEIVDPARASINEQAADLAGLGFWRWFPHSGAVVWSPVLYRIFGVSPASFAANYDNFLSLVHRQDRATVNEFIEAVMRGERPLAGLTYRVERPDGELRWIRADATAQTRRNGVIEEMMGTAIDITPSVLAEQALRARNQQMELAMESSSLVFWDWDLLTDTLTFSPQFFQMLGEATDRDHEPVERWKRRIHPDDIAAMGDQVSRYLAGKLSHYETKYRLRKQSGDWLWAQSTGKIVERSLRGTPLRMVGTTRDISREQWLESEIDKVLGRFSELFEQFGKARHPPAPVEPAPPAPRLSTRQHQLLQLIYAGQSSREIAATLGLEPSTVISHRRVLLRKLNAHSTADLLKAALRHGLVEQATPNRG